ncbi:MAG: hypothetical protein HQM16_19650 [Deltaproteobacteria bacterium]|nr:hypothetical protein [Deltaproteobacteria bacterium]
MHTNVPSTHSFMTGFYDGVFSRLPSQMQEFVTRAQPTAEDIASLTPYGEALANTFPEEGRALLVAIQQGRAQRVEKTYLGSKCNDLGEKLPQVTRLHSVENLDRVARDLEYGLRRGSIPSASTPIGARVRNILNAVSTKPYERMTEQEQRAFLRRNLSTKEPEQAYLLIALIFMRGHQRTLLDLCTDSAVEIRQRMGEILLEIADRLRTTRAPQTLSMVRDNLKLFGELHPDILSLFAEDDPDINHRVFRCLLDLAQTRPEGWLVNQMHQLLDLELSGTKTQDRFLASARLFIGDLSDSDPDDARLANGLQNLLHAHGFS